MIAVREGVLHVHFARRPQSGGLLTNLLIDLVATPESFPKLYYKDPLVYITTEDPPEGVFRIRGNAARGWKPSDDGKRVRVIGSLDLNRMTTKLGTFRRARVGVLDEASQV